MLRLSRIEKSQVCPECGGPWYDANLYYRDHDPGDEKCLKNQVATLKYQLSTLAEDAELGRLVKNYIFMSNGCIQLNHWYGRGTPINDQHAKALKEKVSKLHSEYLDSIRLAGALCSS